MNLMEATDIGGSKKRRTTDAEFMQMARAMYGDKSAKLSKVELIACGDANGVQVPTSISGNTNLKVDAHHWNLSGGSGGGKSSADINKALAKDMGLQVDDDDAGVGPEFDDMLRLSKAQSIARLAATGKLMLFGKKEKGQFFRVPGVEELTAQLERLLARQLHTSGKETMDEQYEELEAKAAMVINGTGSFIKSLLVTGAPSSGKSHTIEQVLKGSNVPKRDYMVKTGSVTDAAMWRLLCAYVDGLLIFDDCDSVVDTKDGKNMLKGALDTKPIRKISRENARALNTSSLHEDDLEEYCDALSRALRYIQTPADLDTFRKILTTMNIYNKITKGTERVVVGDDEESESDTLEPVESSAEEDLVLDFVRNKLPNEIVYKGRIIFISNMDEDEWDSAILTRCTRINLNFASGEMLDFIDKIKDKIKTVNLTDEKKQEVMDYVRELWHTGKLKSAVNFRLIMQAFDHAATNPNWKKVVAKL